MGIPIGTTILMNNSAEFLDMQNVHFCKLNSFASRYIYRREIIKYVDKNISLL